MHHKNPNFLHQIKHFILFLFLLQYHPTLVKLIKQFLHTYFSRPFGSSGFCNSTSTSHQEERRGGVHGNGTSAFPTQLNLPMQFFLPLNNQTQTHFCFPNIKHILLLKYKKKASQNIQCIQSEEKLGSLQGSLKAMPGFRSYDTMKSQAIISQQHIHLIVCNFPPINESPC